MRFLLSTDAMNLADALAPFVRTATVEAEYGRGTVLGRVITMAHHGSNVGNPCPCSYPNGCATGIEAVGLSHIDLDSIGGCAALIGNKPEAAEFWELAEFLDLNGEHRIGESNASEVVVRQYYAWVAWNAEHKVQIPKEVPFLDVTSVVLQAIEALHLICANDHQMLCKGDQYRERETWLNEETFLEVRGSVVVRVAVEFCNHLYTTPDNQVCRAVVTLRTDNSSVTVSLAQPIPGVSCVELCQRLWGDKAGGHAGIAGSPRGQAMSYRDMIGMVELLEQTLAAVA